MRPLQGSHAIAPIKPNAEVREKAAEYRKQLIQAWERFASDTNEANAAILRETRVRIELFLREVGP